MSNFAYTEFEGGYGDISDNIFDDFPLGDDFDKVEDLESLQNQNPFTLQNNLPDIQQQKKRNIFKVEQDPLENLQNLQFDTTNFSLISPNIPDQAFFQTGFIDANNIITKKEKKGFYPENFDTLSTASSSSNVSRESKKMTPEIKKETTPKNTTTSTKRRRKRKREEIEMDNKRLEYLRHKKNKTKEEKDELRKLRNRWSAHKSRVKKRKLMESKDEKINDLQRMVDELKNENKVLKSKIQCFENKYGPLDFQEDLRTNNSSSRSSKIKRRKKIAREKGNRLFVIGFFVFFGLFIAGMIPTASFLSFSFGSKTPGVQMTAGTGGRRSILEENMIGDRIILHENKTRLKINENDRIIKQKAIEQFATESNEDMMFDPVGKDCVEVIFPKKVVADIIYDGEEEYVSRRHENCNCKHHHHCTEETSDEMMMETNEDLNLITKPKKNQTKKEENLSLIKHKEITIENGAVMPLEDDETTVLAYLYRENSMLEEKKDSVFLFCKAVYPLVPTDMDPEAEPDNLVIVYPTETFNEAGGNKVIRVAEMTLPQKDVVFTDSFLSFKKPETSEEEDLIDEDP